MDITTNGLTPTLWIDKYADALYAFTIVRINDTEIAKDIVQDTFLNAWKARESYTGKASEKNWLYAICKNKIIDHYRKGANSIVNVAAREENEYFDEAEHWTPVTKPGEWGMDYTQPVEKKEFYNVLEKCKARLKEIQQTVFVMKYMDDMDSEGICKVLDLKPSYYWVLIHRAKLHLRNCLEKNWVNVQ